MQEARFFVHELFVVHAPQVTLIRAFYCVGKTNSSSKEKTMTIRERLIEDARMQKRDFPQYAGKYEDYVLVRIHDDVKTKSGRAFMKGQLAIAKPKTGAFVISIPTRIVYSPATKVDTSVHEYLVEVISEKEEAMLDCIDRLSKAATNCLDSLRQECEDGEDGDNEYVDDVKEVTSEAISQARSLVFGAKQ